MEYYLAVRMRYGSRAAGANPSPGAHPTPPPLARSEPPTPFVRPSYVRPAVAVGGGRPSMPSRETTPTLRRLPSRDSY